MGVLATNRGMCPIRGTEISAPHGVPVDLLDRVLIIRTMPYSLEETFQILSIRAKTEGIEVEDEALAYASQVCSRPCFDVPSPLANGRLVRMHLCDLRCSSSHLETFW